MICRSTGCQREARAFSPYCTACFTTLLARAYALPSVEPVERLSRSLLPPIVRAVRSGEAPPLPVESKASAPSTGRASSDLTVRVPRAV